MKKAPEIALPSVTFTPTGISSRSANSEWIGRPQLHSDEDGGTYLLLPCQHMDVTIAYGEGTESLEFLVKQIQQRVDEIKEIES